MARLSGRFLYTYPNQIVNVEYDTKKGDTEQEKEQIKALRLAFRWARDRHDLELIESGQPVPRSQTQIKLFDPAPWASDLKTIFYPKYHDLIDLAVYVETHVMTLPYNPLPFWFRLNKYKAHDILINLFLAGHKISTIKSLLGAWIWKQYMEQSEQSELAIISPAYASINLKAKPESKGKTINKHWKSAGVAHTYRRGSNAEDTFATQLHKLNFDNAACFHPHPIPSVVPPTDPRVKIRNYAKPSGISRELYAYLTHHRITSGIIPDDDQIFPLEERLRVVPLSPGMISVIMASLMNSREMHALLSKRTINQVKEPNDQISTLFAGAEKALEHLDIRLRWHAARLLQIQKTTPDRFVRLHFHRQLYELSKIGLRIDIGVLKSKTIAARVKAKYTDKSKLDKINSIRDDIHKSTLARDGRLHGVFKIDYATDRVYTKAFPIQTIPSVFKTSVIAEKNCYFIYLDIVANDLSVLFNLSDDKQGCQLLEQGKDPYQFMAPIQFDQAVARDKVKKFVSPHLYGATKPTVIKESDGLLDSTEYDQVEASLDSNFSDACGWLTDLNNHIKNNGLIPAKLNPFEDVDIPVPKSFGRRIGAPMIIQRMGSNLFRYFIHHLGRDVQLKKTDYRLVNFIHDGLLLEVSQATDPKAIINKIIELMKMAMTDTGLKYINLKIGHGHSWGEAEDDSQNRQEALSS